VHNATTKQRHAALRRKLGIFLGGAPRWVRERHRRAVRLKERIEAALSFAVTPRHVLAAREHAVEAPAPGPSPSALASQAAPTEQALRAFVPPPPPVGPALPAGVLAAPARRAAADAPTVIERPSPREPSRAPDRGPDGPPRTSRVLAGAVASCAAVLAVAFLAELRASPPGARAPLAPEADARPAPSVPAPAPGPDVAPAVAPAAAPAIPTQAAQAAIEVVRGDTLWHLAARHLGDPARWPSLFEANRGVVRDPDLIYPGQALALPSR
jgi:hypothetical protein